MITANSSWDEIQSARGQATIEAQQARSRGDRTAVRECASRIEAIDNVAQQKAELEGKTIK